MEEVFKDDFSAEYKIAADSTNEIINSIGNVDFTPLEKNSPALKNYDWSNYLKCSIARLVHAMAAASRIGLEKSSKVLDFGSYFGNFALAFKNTGYEVDALDSYQKYGAIFEGVRKKLGDEKVNILDFADVGEMLENIPPDTYDLILCMGVIEHIPHTPRFLMDSLDRVLKPNGHLVLETPNLAYIYNREKFASGISVMEKIEAQYYTNHHFEGHHREYTLSEINWILRQIKHEVVSFETFNYSCYSQKYIEGVDAHLFCAMVEEPLLRELILSVSKKNAKEMVDLIDKNFFDTQIFKNKIIELEHFWESKNLERKGSDLSFIGAEWREKYIKMHDHLQEEINKRDVEYKKIHDYLQNEINIRDQMLKNLTSTNGL